MKIIAYAVRPDELESFNKFSKRFGHDVTLVKESFGPDNAHLAKGFEAVCILGNCRANAEAIEEISKLGVKYLATRSAGVNNIDFDEARKFNIRVSNVPAYSPNAVSEFALTLTLALARNLQKTVKRMSLHNFGLNGLMGFELRNKTVGILGTGRIGLHVMKAFKGFDSNIIGYDIYQNDEAKKYLEYKSFDEFLSEADIITMHCPLTRDNYHIINAESIAKMKDGVVLINTARGGLMDIKAVIAGLKSGKIAGLGMDVYENEVGLLHEDFSDEIIQDDDYARLLEFPNVIVTPHCGFYTDEAVSNMVQYSLQNLKDFEDTNECRNEIK